MNGREQQLVRNRGGEHGTVVELEPLGGAKQVGVVERNADAVVSHPPMQLDVDRHGARGAHGAAHMDVVPETLRIPGSELLDGGEAAPLERRHCDAERFRREHEIEIRVRPMPPARVVAIAERGALEGDGRRTAGCLEQRHHERRLATQQRGPCDASEVAVGEPAPLRLGQRQVSFLDGCEHERHDVVVHGGFTKPLRLPRGTGLAKNYGGEIGNVVRERKLERPSAWQHR